jgi:phosphonoacetate hydrolase
VTAVELHGRRYRLRDEPAAVVCLDGLDPSYLEDAFERKLTPRLAELTYALGRSQLPSFTNPNNLSIVTGAPPAVHGLPGNHFLSPDGEQVQLDDPRFLRSPTLHALFAAAGEPVAAVTTKDKLRRLLSAGGVVCGSAERAADLQLDGLGTGAELVGREPPSVYEWDCSHYALELGLALHGALGLRLLYVSLTDFVQHAEPPGGELSDRYLRRLDELVGAYLDAGFRLALVADHGMNRKTEVRYLADELALADVASAIVVLPITDPYVVHHASLGSACWVHVDAEELDEAERVLREVSGVESVLRREEAAAQLALPADRIGDLVVLADAETALGRSAGEHDLSLLRGPLRSHGGRHEQTVPILLSHPPTSEARRLLDAGASNADVHFLLLGDA